MPNNNEHRAHEHENWDFPPLFTPRPDDLPESFLAQPEEPETYSGMYESQCGTADDSQPVEQYDGTLGVTQTFVDTHQAPVGQLQWNDDLASIYDDPGNVSGVRWCTGTLISDDLFLSAGHCFDQTGGGWDRPKVDGTFNVIPSTEIAANMHVNFNYQVDPSGTLRPEQEFDILELVEYRLGGLDFAVVRLDGNPGSAFGTTELSTTDPADDDMLCIISHPAGVPKRIEAGGLFHLHDDRLGYNDIDTLGGSSGAGILHELTGEIVGVHTNGGCNASMSGHNHGVRITSIIDESPTLQQITTPKLKITDEPGMKTLKFLDDPGTVTLKFTDEPGGGTLKFVDEPGGGTLKFVDEPGGGTLKFVDEPGTLKFIDDVKSPGLDKQFGDWKLPGGGGLVDPRRWRGQPGGTGRGGGARPFILQTPHHSMAWARQYPDARGEADDADEQAVQVQYETALIQLEQVLQQGMEELSALDEQYRQLLEAYQEQFGQR